MKKLSTFQITLLAVFGSLALAGIMIFALVTSGSSNANFKPVVIWGTLPEAQIGPILHDMVESDDRFAVVSYVQHDAQKYEADLTNALASGRGPDLFILRDDNARHSTSFTTHFPYTSLSQEQYTSTFLEASQVFLTDDGAIAIPLLVDPLVLYWNKDSLAAAGYTKPPTYWKDVPPMVVKLVTKSDSGSIEKAAIALGTYDNIRAAKTILSTMIQQAGGAITGPDKDGSLRSQLGTQTGLTTAVTALSFYTEFADPLREDYTWTRVFPDAAAAFAAGDVAMYIGYASERAAIVRANPNLNFNIAPIPQIQKGSKLVSSSHIYGIAIARTSENKQGALTIAYVLAGPEMSQKISSALKMTSALRRAVDTAKKPTDETSKALQGLVQDAPKSEAEMLNFEASISSTWIDPDPVRTNAVFRAMIEDVVSGAQKVTEAVQRADAQLVDILTL